MQTASAYLSKSLAMVDYALQRVSKPMPQGCLSCHYDQPFIRHNDGFKKIKADTIIYLEASSSYCEFHIADGTVMVVSIPLSEVAKLLRSDSFIRIHRSFSANRLHIDRFIGNTIVMDEGTKLPIGREYHKAVIGSFTLVGTKSSKYRL